jgi:sugar transferase (PEP-CTERM system associated)
MPDLTLLRRITRRLSNPLLTLLPADALVAALALYLGAWVRFGFDLAAAETALGPLAPRAFSFAFCMAVGLMTMGLYRARQRPTFFEGSVRVLAGIVVGGFAHVLLFYLIPYLNTGRLTLAYAMVITFLAVAALRMPLLRFLDRHPSKRRVLMFGSGRVAAKIGMLRRRSDRRRFDIAGFVPGSEAERRYAEAHGLAPLLAPDASIEDLDVDEVVVALDDRRGTFPTAQLLRHRYLGLPVRDIVDFLEHETGKIDLDVLHPGWLIFATSAHSRWDLRIAKRGFDVVASTLLLVMTSPFLLLVMMSIWAEEGLRAPLIYRQRRVGRGGVVFDLIKFRSMSVDAESDGPQWAARKGDSRVTRTGILIRRFRIDELPQLINVLRGEMSIVGPRPERPEFVDQLRDAVPLYEYRHCMQPGLTGWAQLNFPYGASVEDAGEKLKYDLFYIKNVTLLLDMLILAQTLEVVLWGRAISMAGRRPPAPEERTVPVETAPPPRDPPEQMSLLGPGKRDVA